jgi:hypothetical protein
MASGRDRDPAFRKRRPASSSNVRKKEDTSQKSAEQSKTEDKPEKIAAPKASETPKPEIKEETLTTPVVEPQKKIEPPIDTKPSKKREEASARTSKKSKLVGLVLAVIFLIGLGFLGYYIITSILAKEEGDKPAVENTAVFEEESTDEGEAQGGAVSMEDTETEENSDSDKGSDNEGEAMRETTLTEDNSIENEVKEEETASGTEGSEKNEKKALSNVIRKKGDFEIPCWIVAFSANDKKPLANMNYSALEALGYDAGIYWIPKYFPGGSEMYKVYVGPYKSPEEAQAILPQIKNLQPDAYVMKIDE